MTNGALARFQDEVWRDPVLQERLRGIGDRPAFIASVVEAAQAAGHCLTVVEVEEAMQANQRAWLERWIS